MSELRVYRAKDVQRMLGIGRSAYYDLVTKGLLAYTRLTPGGERVHLEKHLDQYRLYLERKTEGGERCARALRLAG